MNDEGEDAVASGERRCRHTATHFCIFYPISIHLSFSINNSSTKKCRRRRSQLYRTGVRMKDKSFSFIFEESCRGESKKKKKVINILATLLQKHFWDFAQVYFK